jgi:hypothetical protein
MLVLATREAEHFWIVAERSTEGEKTKTPRNELKDLSLRNGQAAASGQKRTGTAISSAGKLVSRICQSELYAKYVHLSTELW